MIVLGVILIGIATLYITIVSIFDIRAPTYDRLVLAIGAVGYLVFIVRLLT